MAQFKAFADATGEKWYLGAWRDKLAAGFTVSGGPSGDKLSTLHYFFTLAMQLGMIWIGLAETPMNDKGINRLSKREASMAAFFKSPAPPGAYGLSERRPVLKLDWRLGADGSKSVAA